MGGGGCCSFLHYTGQTKTTTAQRRHSSARQRSRTDMLSRAAGPTYIRAQWVSTVLRTCMIATARYGRSRNQPLLLLKESHSRIGRLVRVYRYLCVYLLKGRESEREKAFSCAGAVETSHMMRRILYVCIYIHIYTHTRPTQDNRDARIHDAHKRHLGCQNTRLSACCICIHICIHIHLCVCMCVLYTCRAR